MRKDVLTPQHLWHVILLQLVGELARSSADSVAAHYVADGMERAEDQEATKPRYMVQATLNMIEEKQDWSNSLVETALFLRGTTRAREKAKLAEAALTPGRGEAPRRADRHRRGDGGGSAGEAGLG